MTDDQPTEPPDGEPTTQMPAEQRRRLARDSIPPLMRLRRWRLGWLTEDVLALSVGCALLGFVIVTVIVVTEQCT